MAKIKVDPELNLPAIAAAAGQSDITKIVFRTDELYVQDVTQEALDEAVAEALLTADDDKVQRAKDTAFIEVDNSAGNVRAELLTDVPGQELTYLKKEIDAEKFKAAGYPEVDIADYPWIQAEATARSDTGQQAADLILVQAAEWTIVGVAIEEERIRGKLRVEQQMSVAGVNNASNQAKIAIDNTKNK